MLRTEHPLSTEVIFNFYGAQETTRSLYADVLTCRNSILSSGIETAVHSKEFCFLVSKTEHSTLLRISTLADTNPLFTLQSCLEDKGTGPLEDFSVIYSDGFGHDSTSANLLRTIIDEVNTHLPKHEQLDYPRQESKIVNLEEEQSMEKVA